MRYFELNRTFVDASNDVADGDYEIRFESYTQSSGGKTWSDILEHRFVLVLGTAGVGKTSELFQQAKRSLAAGRTAFFLRLDDIADSDFRLALNDQDRALFDTWMLSQDQAIFFLDSIDEAKLVAHSYFNRALSKFVTAVASAAARVNVVLSCRNNDWKYVTDLEAVKGVLFPLAQAMRARVTVPLSPMGNDLAEETTRKKDIEADSDVNLLVVKLEPLNHAQIVKLVKSIQVPNAESFVSALVENDALFMAATPRDIDWLAAYWKKHKKIGTLWDMMSTSVDEKLRERNDAHLAKDTLQPDLSKIGAELVAGANALCRETNLLISDPALDSGAGRQGIDPTRLLTDFSAPLLRNLLSRPIFSAVYAGRLRIEPKQNRSFLAALWLMRLLENGAPRKRILSLLVGEVYGKRKAIGSMVEIAGWIASRDRSIRAHLMQVVPEAVLFMGDPSLIPVQERIEALKSFSRIYTGDIRFDWIVSDIDCARAVHVAMDAEINKLLDDPDLSFDTFKVLLRFAAIGKLPESTRTASRLAHSPKVSSDIRVWAIDAVAKSGTPRQRRKLREAILNGTVVESRLLERASRELFPDTLSLDDLFAIVDLFEVDNSEAIGGPLYTVAHFWVDACPTHLLPEFLRRLIAKVTTPPLKAHRGSKPLLSVRFYWLVEAVARVVSVIFERNAATATADKDVLFAAIALIENAKFHTEYRVSGTDEIVKVLRKKPEARRAYLIQKILSATNPQSFLDGRSFARPEKGDATDILAIANNAADPEIQAKLTIGAVEAWLWSGRSEEELEALASAVEAAPLDNKLRGEARSLLNSLPMKADPKWDNEKQMRKIAEARIRAESKANIESNIENLRNGSNFAAIFYLVKEMQNSPTASNASWAQTDISYIETQYGKQLADALRSGLRHCWRSYTPPLKSALTDRSSVENGVLTGLTALALAFRDGENFAAMSPEDTVTATHYALRELNQFPVWLKDLAEAKPDVVAPTLLGEVWAQLKAPDYQRADIINLREISRSPVLARIVAPHLIAAVSALPHLAAEALSDMLFILDVAGVGSTKRLNTAAAKTKSEWKRDLQVAMVWLKDWMRFKPGAAIDFLEKKFTQIGSQAPTAMSYFLLCIQDDIRNSSSGTYLRDVNLLKRLIPLAYTYLPVATETKHSSGEVYSVTPDDDAREARGHLAALVESIDGIEAHNALRELSEHRSLTGIKKSFARAIERHSARAVEMKPWTVEDVRQFSKKYSRAPETANELFDLVCDRLSDFKESIECDDFGDRGIFAPGTNEKILQRYYAGRFDRESRHHYDVVRETEVADDKKPDIRLHNVKAGMVTVEIKPLDCNRYSFNSLKETLSTQLAGQYMKSARSRHGILLLCLLQSRRWRVNNRTVGFISVVEALNKEAKKLEGSHANVERMIVFGIDMTPWKMT